MSVYLILAGNLAWVQAQDPPIQQLRVMLERHEQTLSPLHLDFFGYRVMPAAPSEERERLWLYATWIHMNHDHFLKLTGHGQDNPIPETRFLWYDGGLWGKLDLESQALQLLPPAHIPLQHPAHLGLRWQGQRLSTWIRPGWARVQPGEVLNGCPTWRVDIRRPDSQGHAQPMRLWIDREREIPLQVGTLEVDARSSSRVTFNRLVRDIEYVAEPGGAWIPQQGRLYEHVRDFTRASYWRLEVDPNSVHTKDGAFADGLFSYTSTDARRSLPHPSSVDDSNNVGPGSIIPEDIWYSTRTPEEIATLAQMRTLILANEAALSTLGFSWAAHRTDNTQSARSTGIHSVPSEATPRGIPYKFREGRFARDHSQWACREDRYVSKSQQVGTTHAVWDAEVLMQKESLATTPGVIDYADQFHWEQVPPLAWTMHVFADARPLTELLVPLLARIHIPLESINGWPVTVVDVRHPERLSDYARIWLDLESGLPLQIDTYQALPWPRLQRTERIKDVALLPLPNGAWLPVKAQRIQYRIAPRKHERVSGMAVDCQTIVTHAHEIDPLLFAAPFRRGERIYNAITDRYERFVPPDETPPESSVKPRTATRTRTRTRREPAGPAGEKPKEPNEIPEVNTPPSIPEPPVEPVPTDPPPELSQRPTAPVTEEQPPPTEVSPSGWPIRYLVCGLLLAAGAGVMGWTRRHRKR